MSSLSARVVLCTNQLLIVVCFVCARKSIVDGINGISKRLLTDAAGRKENLKHASDVEPAKGSGLKLSATVKMEGKAFDTAEECRRILMLLGFENGEDFLQHDQVT